MYCPSFTGSLTGYQNTKLYFEDSLSFVFLKARSPYFCHLYMTQLMNSHFHNDLLLDVCIKVGTIEA